MCRRGAMRIVEYGVSSRGASGVSEDSDILDCIPSYPLAPAWVPCGVTPPSQELCMAIIASKTLTFLNQLLRSVKCCSYLLA